MTKRIITGTIAAGLISACCATAFAEDTSEAARLKKLEQAVSQLQQENAQLKQEIQGATAPAPSAADKIKLSDSITEAKIYGEIRLRYFVNEGEAAGLDAGDHAQRERFRYRFRLGTDVKLIEGWSAGFMFETGSVARSANVTLGENPFFAKSTLFKDGNFIDGVTTTSKDVVTGIDPKTGKLVKGVSLSSLSLKKGSVVTNVNYGDTIFLGRVYLKYQPTDWLTITGGKIANPFVSTRMVWDPDINPEGLAEQVKFTIGGGSSAPASYSKDSKDGKAILPAVSNMSVDLFANFAQFIYDDVGFENNFNAGNGPFSQVPDGTDRWLLGWQIGAKVNFNQSTYFQIAPTLYNYTGGGATSAGPFNGDSPIVVLDHAANPKLVTFNQTGTNDLCVFDVPVEFGFKVWNIPASIFGDFAHNFDGQARAEKAGHANRNESNAYQVGASLGSAKKKGDFELRGWYQHSEQFALDQNIVDDDIFDGRLNMEGFYLQASYQISNGISAIVQYCHGNRIDSSLGTAGFGALGTPAGFPLQSYNMVYVDLNVKF